MATGKPQRALVLYDGKCRFCRLCAYLLARLDRHRRLALLPFSHPGAARYLQRLPTHERYSTVRVIDSGGRQATGGDALIAAAEAFPSVRTAAFAVGRLPVLHKAVNGAYSAVARRRALLSKLVPDTPQIVRSSTGQSDA